MGSVLHKYPGDSQRRTPDSIQQPWEIPLGRGELSTRALQMLNLQKRFNFYFFFFNCYQDHTSRYAELIGSGKKDGMESVEEHL